MVWTAVRRNAEEAGFAHLKSPLDLGKRGVRVLLCEANERVAGKLEKAGILEAVGPGGYHESFLGALVHCRSLNDDKPTLPA